MVESGGGEIDYEKSGCRFPDIDLARAAKDFFDSGEFKLTFTAAGKVVEVSDFVHFKPSELEKFVQKFLAILPENLADTDYANFIYDTRTTVLDFLQHYIKEYRLSYPGGWIADDHLRSAQKNKVLAARDRQSKSWRSLLPSWLPFKKKFFNGVDRGANTMTPMEKADGAKIIDVVTLIAQKVADVYNSDPDAIEERRSMVNTLALVSGFLDELEGLFPPEQTEIIEAIRTLVNETLDKIEGSLRVVSIDSRRKAIE